MCFPLFAYGQDAGVVDRGVAAVDGRLITHSQLEFEARVLLVNAGGVEAAFAPLDITTLEAALNTVIDQRLATLEADKLDSWALEPGELEHAVRAFEDRFASPARFRQFLASQDADLADVQEVLRRALRAQRVLDSRLKLKAQVSEAEVRAAQAERTELVGLPADVVRQKLYAERFNRLVRAELTQARKATDVRLLAPVRGSR